MFGTKSAMLEKQNFCNFVTELMQGRLSIEKLFPSIPALHEGERMFETPDLFESDTLESAGEVGAQV